MATYLVTGGCGFIGCHLVAQLLAAGHRVQVLDDLSLGQAENLPEAAGLIIGDVTDPGTVAAALEGADGCFHLAAVTALERLQDDAAASHRVNLDGALHVFEAARYAGADGGPVPVVYASSAAVYGDFGDRPLPESAPLQPTSAYGADKVACELHARVADLTYGVPAIGLRLFNVYGPGQEPSSPYAGVISAFARRIGRGEPVTLYGDGDQVRDFVYVGDVVRLMAEAMAHPDAGAPIYNVGTGVGTSIRQLALLVGQVLGRRVTLQQGLSVGGDLRVAVADPAALIATFGQGCTTGLAEGLRLTFEQEW